MDITILRRGMTCGSAKAESRTYKKINGSRPGTIWLVANQEEAADNVYFHDSNDHNSDGFAGRVIHFQLESTVPGQTGDVISLKGPWHSNANALFSDTGYDCRATCRTRVIVSKGHAYDDKYRQVLTDVIYNEPKEGKLGLFDRDDEIAQKIADETGETVYLYSESSSGSCSRQVKPSKKE